MQTIEQVDARKTRYEGKDALDVLKDISEIYVSKGKNVRHIDLRKDRPDDATLKSLLLGPSGNLRAPTLRVGKKLIVGFDEETYKKLLS